MGFFNLLWFIFGGGIVAAVWLVLAVLFSITVIGIPIGKACFELAKLSAFPFGKEIIRETELKGADNVSDVRKIGGLIANIIWFPIGLVLAISYLALGICFCISLIGIPFGIVYVRTAKFVIAPIGAKCVSKKQAYASAVANELEKRQKLSEKRNGGMEKTVNVNDDVEKPVTFNEYVPYVEKKKEFKKPIDIPDAEPTVSVDTMIKIDSMNLYISNTPVTQQLYESVMGNNPSHFRGEYKPVEFVSWYDAIEFCNKLSEKEGLEKAYAVDKEHVKWNEQSKGYRLLTSSEWESVAKVKYAGNYALDKIAWYNDNSIGRTHNVAIKEPNEYELYDIIGNVWEWVWDENEFGFAYGGSWGDIAKSCKVLKKSKCHPNAYYVSVGMRVARSI